MLHDARNVTSVSLHVTVWRHQHAWLAFSNSKSHHFFTSSYMTFLDPTLYYHFKNNPMYPNHRGITVWNEPERTRMYPMDRIRLNGPNWAQWLISSLTMNQVGLNEPKWTQCTKLDSLNQNCLNWTQWTRMDQNDLNWTQWTKVALLDQNGLNGTSWTQWTRSYQNQNERTCSKLGGHSFFR